VHLPALKEGDMTRRKPDVTKMHSLLRREFTSLEEGIKAIIRSSHFVVA
jgi:UDP-glucuronate decarboxylase